LITTVLLWSSRKIQMNKEEAIKLTTNIVFYFWLVLILPWFVFAGLAGMAFDGGPTRGAYVFVISVWTYPLSVLIVGFFRRRVPWVTILPVLNFCGMFAADRLTR